MAIFSTVLSFLASPQVTILLAVFIPSLQFISLNQKFYSSKQIKISLILSFIVGLILSVFSCFLFSFLNALSLSEVLKNYHIHISNTLGTLFALFFFFLLAERFFDEIFGNKVKEQRAKIAISLFFLAVATFYSCALLNIVLFILLTTSFLDARKKASEVKEILFDERIEQLYSTDYTPRNVKLTHKPHIYLLLLESYHSARALKELYGIDDSQTDIFLQEQGFTDYENVFSNAHITFPSIANLLHAKLHQDTRRGSAFALDVLRENGYKCEFFDSQFYVFGEYMQEKDFASFAISERDRKLYLYFAPLLGQSKYLRALVKDVDPFKTEITFDKLYQDFKDRLSLKHTSPTFYALRFGADHVNVQATWNTDAENFKNKLYPFFVARAQEQIRIVVTSIVEHDPSALILAIGDHGGLQHINIAPKRKDLQKTLKNNLVTNAEFALDMFSVRCAIKWPYPHKTKNKVLSHVNIFRYIFEALGADEEVLKGLLPNLSIYNKTNDIVVREGKILEEVEAYFTPELIAEIKKNFDEGKASEEDCLLLASRSKRRERLEILEWAIKAYAQEEIALAYVNALYDNGKSVEALEIAKKSMKTYKSLSTRYYQILSEVLPQQCIEEIDSQKNNKSMIDAYTKYSLVIDAFIRLDKKEDALAHIDEMMLAFASNQNATAFMANRCIVLNEAQKALLLLIKVENPSSYYEFWKYCTLVCMSAKQYETAEEAAQILVQMHPTETWSWLLYAYILQKLGKVQEAITLLIEAQRKVAYPAALRELLGHIVIKHGIQEGKLQLYKTFAEKHMQKCLEIFVAHKALDKDYYIKQKPSLKSAALAHMDYISEGVFEGMNPSTWFNSFYYLLNNQDVWLKGLNPFMHFYEEGMMQLRAPSVKHNIREIFAENQSITDDKQELFEAIVAKWGRK